MSALQPTRETILIATSTSSPKLVSHNHASLADAIAAVESVLRGHPRAVRLVMAALLARGHVLLEDVPGVGKTTLARAIARILGESFSRIQFTADMLPSDVIGVQVLDAEAGEFRFKPGPLFAQVVLADEINRASPKTQSATLEAMAEGAVTVDDRTYPLPQPFVVLATQNPVEHHGAYPLPESQLDRFSIGISLGYPSPEHERALLQAPSGPADNLQKLPVLLNPARMQELQQAAAQIHLSDVVADYLLQIVAATREHPDVLLGCSPRGTIHYGAVARAWAFLDGRDFVRPDDVKQVALAVLGHRLVVGGAGLSSRARVQAVLEDIVARVPAPR